MTDEEAVDQFYKNQANTHSDAEGKHAMGDTFVADILRVHGFPKLAAAYDKERCNWWYA